MVDAFLVFVLFIFTVGSVITLIVVGKGREAKGYARGYIEGTESVRKAIGSEPYVCPHPWDPWSKARSRIAPGGGWARIQRRVCPMCGEEQERIVE